MAQEYGWSRQVTQYLHAFGKRVLKAIGRGQIPKSTVGRDISRESSKADFSRAGKLGSTVIFRSIDEML